MLPVLLWTLAFVMFAITASIDYQDEQIEQTHYCEMVQLWNDHLHLPPEERPGWPPYKGGCHGAQ